MDACVYDSLCIYIGIYHSVPRCDGTWIQAVLQSQVHPDVVNFNAAISALAVAGRASQAQDLLDCMAPRRLGAGQSSIIFGHWRARKLRRSQVRSSTNNLQQSCSHWKDILPSTSSFPALSFCSMLFASFCYWQLLMFKIMLFAGDCVWDSLEVSLILHDSVQFFWRALARSCKFPASCFK